jgi:cysteine-rich repeat protein
MRSAQVGFLCFAIVSGCTITLDDPQADSSSPDTEFDPIPTPEGPLDGTPFAGVNNDTCVDAGVIDLAPGDLAFRHGTFQGALDDYNTWCADYGDPYSYPDVVHQLTLIDDCVVDLLVDGDAGFESVVSIRSEGCEIDSGCSYKSGALQRLVLPLESGVHWVVLSDAGTGSSTYALTARCTAPVCGDAVVSKGEVCDDGNTAPGDGCDAQCQAEPADPSLDTCAGASVGTTTKIAVGEVLQFPSTAPLATTLGADDSGTGSCSLQPDGVSLFAAPDHVVRVRPLQPGTLRVRLGNDLDGNAFCGATEPEYPYPDGCYDRVLHVREGNCGDPTAEVACSDNAMGWYLTEEVSFPALDTRDYFIFADGWNDDEFGVGTYTLWVTLEP